MNNNPMRYTDPSGYTVDDCNRAGASCGGSTYNQGLAWGQSDWEARGVSFSGRGWTTERIAAAATALNGVRDAIGYHETVTLLGLDEEGLTLNMFLNPQDFANGSNCPGNNPCFHADSNSIDFNPESDEPIVTWTHEIAHSFDFHAGGGSDYSTSIWIQSIPGWSQDMSSVWSFSGDRLDVASDYGLSDPREDYAETFTWRVFTRNGWNLTRKYREPSLLRQTELQESFR